MRDQYELLDVNECRTGQLELFQPVEVDAVQDKPKGSGRQAVARFRLRYRDQNNFLIHEKGETVRGIVFDDEPSVLYIRYRERMNDEDRQAWRDAMNEHYRDEFKELERFCLHNNIPRDAWEIRKPNVVKTVKYYHEREGV